MDSPRGTESRAQPALGGGPVMPIQPGERLVEVDILRGFAVFGILLVNMAYFSAPLAEAWLEMSSDRPLVDRLARWAIRTLAEGKFYTLFSFLFGLGMAIQMQRIADRGGRFVRLYVRRLLVLLAIGLAHALLLWFGDILTLYALVGFLLLLFRKRSLTTIVVWAVLAYTVPLVFTGGFTVAFKVGQLVPQGRSAIQEEMANWQDEVAQQAEECVVAYRGSFGDALEQRLVDHGALLGVTAMYMMPNVFALFLLGLYVGRRRILYRLDYYARDLRWLVVCGLPLGLLCNVGYTASVEIGGLAGVTWVTLGGYALNWIGTPLLSFGYAAAIILLARRERWRRRMAPLAAVGRMALTNYLLQTIVCTTLFYGYGFGLFDKIGAAGGLLLTVVIYALQIPLSVWWLRTFRFGPLEWLWRSATYGVWQPMHLPRSFPPPTQGLIG